MTNPIAEAVANMQKDDAAPSSTEPSLIDEIKDGIHMLEEKLDHLIHPSAEVAQPGESFATDTASNTPPMASFADTSATDTTPATADASNSPSTVSGSSGGIDPNVDAPFVAGGAESFASLAPHVGIFDASENIRGRLMVIKCHLIGFEESIRQKIHAELDAIERLL